MTQQREEPLITLDELSIYRSRIEMAGRTIPIDHVERVSGGTTQVSMNGMSIIRKSSISIGLSSGESFEIKEETAHKGNRHKKIQACVTVLRKLTIERRLRAALFDLKKRGCTLIGRRAPRDEPSTIPGILIAAAMGRYRENDSLFREVTLGVDGTISDGELSLDLTRCRREGTLQLGVYRGNSSSSSTVYASHLKSFFFERGARTSLKFLVSSPFGEDAAMLMLDYLSRGGGLPEFEHIAVAQTAARTVVPINEDR